MSDLSERTETSAVHETRDEHEIAQATHEAGNEHNTAHGTRDARDGAHATHEPRNARSESYAAHGTPNEDGLSTEPLSAHEAHATGKPTRSHARHEFFATCPRGFEKLLAGELASMGISGVRALNGQVAFSGTLAQAYRACLWSRLASRVVLVLAHVGAADSDALYASLYELPWENHLALSGTFAVDAHGTNANLRNTQFVALRAKDAICDRMQAKLGGRPNVDARHPGVSVVVRLRNTRATCGIDLTGTPLFRRGTGRRAADDGLGGLRADYAAALLAAGAWHRCCRRDAPTLVATFSGSGAVLVEAAGIALDRAPGLLRPRWGFEHWLGHDEAAWNALIDEADERAEAAAGRTSELSLIALDPRSGAASAGRQALVAAGFGNVALETPANPNALATVLAEKAPDADALLATLDLSWLNEDEQAREVAALGLAGNMADALPQSTGIAALASGTSIDAALGLSPRDVIGVIVGRDAAAICTYVTDAREPAQSTSPSQGTSSAHTASSSHENAPAPARPAPRDAHAGRRESARHAEETASRTEAAAPRASVTLKDGTVVPVLVAASDQFAARLTKVAKLRAKWGRREDISCYRVYDADLPDYAVAIDLYQASLASRGDDVNRRWLVVQEYAPPRSIDPDLAHKRLLDVLAIAPHVLGVDPADVALRVRRRAKGGSQYADAGDSAMRRGGMRPGWLDLAPGAHLVDEGGLTFEVNFADYLDTGLFLDHRDVRAEVREMMKATLGSQRFLNLFAYTGTATCYAADGGAGYTTTVDLSYTYLDWARRNMARNGFTGKEHEFVQADVVGWVSEQRHTPNRWDLIFCDPPTFSNSKRMRDAAFDVQRDHAELLIGISRLLTRNGVCLFSCNLRGFEPDVEKLAKAGVEIQDVTAGTIPEDFKRNAKIHHAYLIRRTPRPL